MIDILLLTILFYFIQIPLPMIVSVINGVPLRAHNNLKESLFIFIPLSLLSIIINVDVLMAATIWLVLRVIYVILYSLGVTYIRTILWFISIICLVDMGIRLFKHSI
jgi:uncharacterized MAPEG superfamily protein